MNPEDFSLGVIPDNDASFRDPSGTRQLADARAARVQLCLSSVVGKFPFIAGVTTEEYSLGTSFLKSCKLMLFFFPSSRPFLRYLFLLLDEHQWDYEPCSGI